MQEQCKDYKFIEIDGCDHFYCTNATEQTGYFYMINQNPGNTFSLFI